MADETNRLVWMGVGGVAAAGLLAAIWQARAPEAAPGVPEGDAAGAEKKATWSPPPGEPREACAFERGDVSSYEVTDRTDMTLDPAVLLPEEKQSRAKHRPKQAYTTKVGATLSVYAWGTSPHGETILAIRLAGYDGTLNGVPIPASEVEGIEKVSLARMDRRCRVVAMARHESVDPKTQLVVQGMLDALNYELPDDRSGASAHSASFQDDLGPYSADLRFDPKGRGHGVLRREKKSYPLQDDAATVEYRIVRSSAVIELGETAWFDRFEREDVIFGDVGNKPLSQIKQTTTVERVRSRAQDFDGLDIEMSEYVWGRVNPEPEFEETENTGLAGMPLEMAVAEYKRLLSSGEMSDWLEARAFLRAFLRANPDQAFGLIDLMVGEGEFSEWERAVIMHVLSETGIPETREALLSAAGNAALDEKTRLQASVAAGDLVNPDAATIGKLAELGRRADGARTSENDMVGNASNFAVGTLLGEHGATNPEVAAAARGYIGELLEHEDPKRLREGLGAVANSGDASFLPTLSKLAEDPDSTTRRAVMRAIGRMDPEQTRGFENKVRGQLYRDDDEMVSQDYAQAKSEQIAVKGERVEVTDAEVWTWVAEFHAARQEPTRLQYVELLGRAAQLNPEAGRALAGIYWVARSAAVRKAIGSYLTGEQIAAGRTRP